MVWQVSHRDPDLIKEGKGLCRVSFYIDVRFVGMSGRKYSRQVS